MKGWIGGIPLAASVMAMLVSGVAVGAPGDIRTIAGTGEFDYGGDGGPARQAKVNLPSDIDLLPGGGYLIADKKNHRVRKVTPTGEIRTIAGTGVSGYNGDGRRAKTAQLSFPTGVDAISRGRVLIADSLNHRVRMITRRGKIRTVAGHGTEGFSGDGGGAKQAELSYPAHVSRTRDGGFLIPDFNNNRVRKVSSRGIIRTIAGNGTAASTGDGGRARLAAINNPSTAEQTKSGAILISEHQGHRIRRVTTNGTIRTVAGTGVLGFSGDGGPARHAELASPTSATPTPGGGFLLADYGNHRIRKVTPRGKIRTVAGNGTDGFSGDGGPARQAQLASPAQAIPMPDGGFLIADFFNNRIRRVVGR